MNNFALSADSRSWWLPSAVAGGIGAIALGAILVLSNTGQAAPVGNAPDSPAVSVPGADVGRACFMQRPPRNINAEYELPQPACAGNLNRTRGA